MPHLNFSVLYFCVRPCLDLAQCIWWKRSRQLFHGGGRSKAQTRSVSCPFTPRLRSLSSLAHPFTLASFALAAVRRVCEMTHNELGAQSSPGSSLGASVRARAHARTRVSAVPLLNSCSHCAQAGRARTHSLAAERRSRSHLLSCPLKMAAPSGWMKRQPYWPA